MLCVFVVEVMSVIVSVTFSNEYEDPTTCVVQLIGAYGGELCFCFRVELVFLNCYDICMSVVYVDLQYDTVSLTFTSGYLCVCGVCSHVVVLGLNVRLSLYPVFWVWWLR